MHGNYTRIRARMKEFALSLEIQNNVLLFPTFVEILIVTHNATTFANILDSLELFSDRKSMHADSFRTLKLILMLGILYPNLFEKSSRPFKNAMKL